MKSCFMKSVIATAIKEAATPLPFTRGTMRTATLLRRSAAAQALRKSA